MSDREDKLEARVLNMEDAIKLLTQLALRADERMDELEEAQANSERKLAALADAQIRTEEAQANSERKIAALTDAQIRTDESIAKLFQAQQRTEESVMRLSSAMEGLANKMAELASAHTHTDRRLDTLIDIVRERLGGQPQA